MGYGKIQIPPGGARARDARGLWSHASWMGLRPAPEIRRSGVEVGEEEEREARLSRASCVSGLSLARVP